MNQAIYHTLEAYRDKVDEINLFLGYPDNRGTDTYATFNPNNVGTDEEPIYLLSIIEEVLHLFNTHMEFTEGYASLITKKSEEKPVRVLIPIRVFKEWQESDDPEIVMLIQYCYTHGITEAELDPSFYEGYDLDKILPRQIMLEYILDEHKDILLKHGAIVETNIN